MAGWRLERAVCEPSRVRDAVLSMARSLGEPVEAFPGAGLVQELVPREPSAARSRNSLTSRYGLGAFPLHTDGATSRVPFRHVVLGCERADVAAPTRLVRWNDLPLSADLLELLGQPVYLVRSGRASFLTLVVDHEWVRFDGSCMAGQTISARKALRSIGQLLQDVPQHEVAWRPGDILILDNWRVLHGRAEVQGARSLWRVMVR